jgi:small subunit ribosomal protein S7
MKNMIAFARKRGGKSMADKLAAEIMTRSIIRVVPSSVRRICTALAEANRAFAHFRF